MTQQDRRSFLRNLGSAVGASAALAISDIPWGGPIGCVRVALIDGQFVANPTIAQMYTSSLDLIYVGTKKDMLMIEGSADQLPEDKFIEALELCTQRLPAKTARVFMMREVLEMSTEEICKELGITPTNLWVILHRARLSLRECIEIKWGAAGA